MDLTKLTDAEVNAKIAQPEYAAEMARRHGHDPDIKPNPSVIKDDETEEEEVQTEG